MFQTIQFACIIGGIVLVGGGDANEIFKVIQESVQALVYIVGGAVAVIGAIDALSGYSNQSSGKMSEGIIKAVGGAGIVLLGNKLVPAIFSQIGM